MQEATKSALSMPLYYAGFDLLATAIVIARLDGQVLHANSAFEVICGLSTRALTKLNLCTLMDDDALLKNALASMAHNEMTCNRFEGELIRPLGQTGLPVQVLITASGLKDELIIEMLPIEHQARHEREDRLFEQTQAHKELVRNLAHEIKNPLGGIRGAAQLLQMELSSPELSEYTQVIIHEADRLQTLVDRLLEPHSKPQVLDHVNIHEVCERVSSLILAEFPHGLEIVRDYDTSIPELRADKSQLIQVVLNIARNAAQALKVQIANGSAVLEFRTRVSQLVTYNKQRHKLALELHIIDNGPGIPEEIKERIFYPLVSGRDGGTGLGLTLAQTFIHRHQGFIECKSQPGYTDFTIQIPLSS